MVHPSCVESLVPELDIFYIIDMTASMSGAKCEAIHKMLPTLMDIIDGTVEKENASAKVNVLLFNDNTRWLFPEPVLPLEMKDLWISSNPMHCDGGADYGRMFFSLEKALHRGLGKNTKAQLNSIIGHMTPIIILVTESSALYDWHEGLRVLISNGWFQNSIRIVIAMGGNMNTDVLYSFASSIEKIRIEDVPLDMAQYGNVAIQQEEQTSMVYTVHSVDQFNKAILEITSIAVNPGNCIGSITKHIKKRCDSILPEEIVNPCGNEIDDFY